RSPGQDLAATKRMSPARVASGVRRWALECRPAAGVAQWQSRSFPSLRRGFDSLHPLQSLPPPPAVFSCPEAPTAPTEPLTPGARPTGRIQIKEAPVSSRSDSPENDSSSGNGLRVLASFGLGAALMYLYDPQAGRRRRALLRDQM